VGSVGGLVGALNIGQVVLKPIDGANIVETPVDIDGDLFRGNVSIGARVSSLVADNVTGQILTANTIGGAEQVAARLSGVLNGGDVKVSNLRFDLANKQVIADMEGAPLVLVAGTSNWVPGTTTVKKDLVLWTITDITGPTAMRPEALLAAGSGDFSLMQADGYTLLKTEPTSDPRFPLFTAQANNVFSNLKVTQAGFDFFTASLGIKSTSTAYATLKGVNDQADGWGTITSTMAFSQAELPGPYPAIPPRPSSDALIESYPAITPEPSSYVLMGLGLIGIALVARRRQT
jgi:hypothetical protein